MTFEFNKLEIPDVVLIKPQIFTDSRGIFFESYRDSMFKDNGINQIFKQDNHSRSAAGVLRGLHYQLRPHEQGKLVRVIAGRIFDVAVDIRKGSPTFGKWISAELSEEKRNMLWIPQGFAHGFLALEDRTEVIYKATEEYDKESECGIVWNDPEIAIKWPIKNPILSEKDLKSPKLKDAKINFKYGS